MKLFNFFKTNKLLLLNILLTFYIATNLIGGERGIFSYFEKKEKLNYLIVKKNNMVKELKDYKLKNELLSKKMNLDYIDMIYREKLKFGKQDEIIIKLR